MLTVRDLSAGYDHLDAVRGVDLELAEGELVSVIGTNGAGKSALMLGVAGLLRQTGQVMLEGVDLSRRGADHRSRAGLVLVPEGRQVFAGMTVLDNLLSGSMHARGRNGRDERLEMVLDLFPRLRERRTQRAESMSGGEQQMVAIGRTLMANPRVLMLDEPTLGLAPSVSAEVFAAVAQLRDAGMTILLVEQNVQHCLEISDRAHVLDRGQIVLSGAGRELLADPRVRSTYLDTGEAPAPVDR